MKTPYPLPTPPPAFGFRSPTCERDLECIAQGMQEHLHDPVFPDWLEDYATLMHCPKWKNNEEPLAFPKRSAAPHAPPVGH